MGDLRRGLLLDVALTANGITSIAEATMRLSTMFRLGVVTGVLGCALSAGCSGDSSIPHLAAADTVEVEVESDTATVSPLRSAAPDTVITARRTPVLTKRIDSMTNVEVGNYLRTLAYRTGGYSTEEETVPCVHADSTPCAPSDSAHVIIQPEAGMNRWQFDSIPPTGLVVGRIINDAPAGRYAHNFRYPPQRKTWWVVDDSAGTLRSRYFTRTYSNVGPAITFVTNTRTFSRCVHDDAPAGRPARAKFWDCTQSYADTLPVSLNRPFRSPPTPARGERLAARSVSLVSTVPLPRAPSPAALASNWVTCDAGCCASQ